MSNLNCFHCGLDNPEGINLTLTLFDKKRYFCCHGCIAIAETLAQNDMLDFYRFRERPSSKPEELIPQDLLKLEALDSPEILEEISQSDDDLREIQLGIEGITCGACGWLIEKHLSKIDYVREVSVNVSTHRAIIKWHQSGELSAILKSLRKLGYIGYPFSENEYENHNNLINRQYTKRLLVAALGMMQVMTYALAVYIGEFQDLEPKHQMFFHWLSGLIATPVVFYSALPFFTSAYNNLKRRHLGMNLPVSIAILAGYFASCYSLLFGSNVFYFDSIVMFTFFLLIGRYLEHRARYRSLLKQQNFSQLLPLTASKKQPDGTVQEVSLSQVKPGDELVIYAGGVIPVDGVLESDAADINEAILTGEFLPVEKSAGDTLLSGTTNHSASISMKVTRGVKQSHLQSLINLQAKAEQLKPRSISLADGIAHWYVAVLLVLVSLSGIYWFYHEQENTFAIVLSVLVVSCPCALSLATPAAIAAATSKLSDLGLMLRTASAFDDMQAVKHIVFDKTGTLTLGQIEIRELHVHNNNPCRLQTIDEIESHHYFEIACQLEQVSNHPIATAFRSAKHKSSGRIKNTQEFPGLGVSGQSEGNRFRLGNRAFVESHGIALKDNRASQNETQLFLVDQNQHLATFILEDRIKNSANSAIKQLQQLGYEISILSGDSNTAVKNIARRLKLTDVHAEMSPNAKLDFIHQRQKQGQNCLMVGDGFNDVGALSAAKMSITIGSGTQLSKSASGAVLVAKDLNVIPQSLALARKVNRIIKQNLAWAVSYNLLAVPFAMMGYIPAWLAAIGMSLSSLIVVLNALRLKSN